MLAAGDAAPNPGKGMQASMRRCCGCGSLIVCTFRRVLCLWGFCALCRAWRMPVLQSRAGLSWKGGPDAGVPGAQYRFPFREPALWLVVALPWHQSEICQGVCVV